MMAAKTAMIGFGGGCHWCTEAVFQTLNGVHMVEQGFMRSDPPDDDWSEAVKVSYDPKQIDLAVLIDIHLRTHASTLDHSMRGKYRSAIYTFSHEQKLLVQSQLQSLQAGFEKPLITQALRHTGFKSSQARFQNYYVSDPDRPFCQRHIDPKLRLLRAQFSKQLRS